MSFWLRKDIRVIIQGILSNTLNLFKFGKKVNKKVEKLIKLLSENGKVLDLGCGMGANSIFLMKQGFEVTAVDKDINSKLKEKHPKINFIEKDILEFDFPEQEYDLVLAINLLHFFNLEDIRLLIDKIIKSLKNNGLLYLQVFSKKDLNKKFHHLFDKQELLVFFSKNKIIEIDQFLKKENHPPTGEHEHNIIRMLVRKS